MEAPITLGSVEALARARVDPTWREYFAGGSGDEWTLRANVAAFGRYALRPRVLAGIERTSAATTVLGHELAFPLVVAPMGFQRMAHADGEEGFARAAATAGAGYCLSTMATADPASVSAAAPGAPRFLQIYVFRDRALTDDLIAEALDASFSSLFLTVDLPVLGARDRERSTRWALPELEVPAVVRVRGRGAGGDVFSLLEPALDWRYVEHLVSRFGAPVVVKGILTAEDGRLAADHGAAGVVVSNHGGRQLDGVMPSLEALPEVVDAVADRLEVYVDGGVRRGRDVVAALALGARAVLAGRTPLWGFAANGEQGARTVLELLREEVEVALHLLGCATPADVTPEHVVRLGR